MGSWFCLRKWLLQRSQRPHPLLGSPRGLPAVSTLPCLVPRLVAPSPKGLHVAASKETVLSACRERGWGEGQRPGPVACPLTAADHSTWIVNVSAGSLRRDTPSGCGMR